MTDLPERLRERGEAVMHLLCDSECQGRCADCPAGVMREMIAALSPTPDRNSILEEAAVACEKQREEFRSPEYATNQPLSSIQERFACGECAAAIRALKTKTHPTE